MQLRQRGVELRLIINGGSRGSCKTDQTFDWQTVHDGLLSAYEAALELGIHLSLPARASPVANVQVNGAKLSAYARCGAVGLVCPPT